MKTLKYSGDISFDEVFTNNRWVIYESLIMAIDLNLAGDNRRVIDVITIDINKVEYNISLSSDRFISGLNSAIEYFKQFEEYEKCAKCLSLIKKIEGNN
jgi:hypothetical protein